jgi:hypothetical protein
MMHVNVRVDPGQVLAEMQRRQADNLARAVVWYHSKLLEVLNVPNTGQRVFSRTRRTPSGRRASSTVYPNPSRPGEPPRKRTGWLQRNVVYTLDRQKLTGTVGVTINAKYGLYLELGTRRMAARPWFLATLRRYTPQISNLLRGGTA